MGATTKLQVNQGFADYLQFYIFCLIIMVVVSANAMFDYNGYCFSYKLQNENKERPEEFVFS